MSIRHQPLLRSMARRLPITGTYERRLAESAANVTELQNELDRQIRENSHWVPLGHFYSPFVDVDSLNARFDSVYGTSLTDLAAIDLRIEQQTSLFTELDSFASNLTLCSTPLEAENAGFRYWSENPAYGDTDARFLTAILQHFRPKRLIELGCGYSSAATLDARERFLDSSLEITFVDPYPELLESLIRDSDRSSVEVLAVGTQDVELDVIRQLDDGDVLFIDSTHVSKPGSDVNRIFFEILPALRPGVIIHFHDIFPRFEYPPAWVEERRAWTEQYVLRAFLQYNSSFEVVLWPGLLWAMDRTNLEERYPAMRTNAGGAFWMRKLT
jgi:predicted O-methyltransferase YrrM